MKGHVDKIHIDKQSCMYTGNEQWYVEISRIANENYCVHARSISYVFYYGMKNCRGSTRSAVSYCMASTVVYCLFWVHIVLSRSTPLYRCFHTD
jgi:hypothetical protein